MLTWDKFQSVWDASRRPYWWLYQGRGKGNLIGSNSENENLVESWDALSELVETYGEGVYTVELRTSPNASRGNPVHTFQFGDDAVVVGSVNRTAMPRPASDTGFMKGVDAQFLLTMQRESDARQRKLELENLELKMRNERMKEEMNDDRQPDAVGRVFSLLEKNPAVLDRIAGLLSGGPAARPAVGVLKADKPIPKHPPQQKDIEDEGPEDLDDDDDEVFFSIDRAVNACSRLIRALPDYDVNDLLDKLADIAENDPGKLETAIKFL